MALSAGVRRSYSGGYELGSGVFVIAPSVSIYESGALTIQDGIVRPLTAGAGKKFIGFALGNKTTTAGMTFEKLGVQIRGLCDLTIPGAALSDMGGVVYATDDNTFTVSSAGNAVPIGRIVGAYLGKWSLLFDAFCMRYD